MSPTSPPYAPPYFGEPTSPTGPSFDFFSAPPPQRSNGRCWRRWVLRRLLCLVRPDLLHWDGGARRRCAFPCKVKFWLPEDYCLHLVSSVWLHGFFCLRMGFRSLSIPFLFLVDFHRMSEPLTKEKRLLAFKRPWWFSSNNRRLCVVVWNPT